MKVAVCLSGQPRFVEECFPSIYNNIIKPNNADVFMHGWYDDEMLSKPYKYGGDGEWKNKRIEKDIHKKAIELYKPVDYLFESQIKFACSKVDFQKSVLKFQAGALDECTEAGENFETYCDRLLFNGASMFYSIFQSNHIKERYSWNNNIHYDAVIRCRFDVNVGTPIVAKDYDLQYVYYEEMGQPQPLVSDWVNLGSSTNMNIHSLTFFNIRKIYEDAVRTADSAICSELNLAVTLARGGVPVRPAKWNLSIPRF